MTLDALSLFWIFPLIGIPAGLIAGLLGVGGGVILVPLLVMFGALLIPDANAIPQMAVATSLSTIVFTSVSSIWGHYRHGAVVWPLAVRLSVGIVVGALLGTWLAHRMNPDLLIVLFAGFLALTGLRMTLQWRPPSHERPLSASTSSLGGLTIGTLSALFGIGGGSLTVPFLVFNGTPMRQAIGTGAACGFPIAVASTVGFVVWGWQQPPLPEYTLGYVVWPATLGIISTSLIAARIGAWCSHRLPVATLKRVFGVLLIIVAARMMI